MTNNSPGQTYKFKVCSESFLYKISNKLMSLNSGVSWGCIACACTPGGLRGAPKRRGEKERSKERERKKGKEKGRQRMREGKGKKICKRKGKEGRNQKKIGYKKKNTRVATRE